MTRYNYSFNWTSFIIRLAFRHVCKRFPCLVINKGHLIIDQPAPFSWQRVLSCFKKQFDHEPELTRYDVGKRVPPWCSLKFLVFLPFLWWQIITKKCRPNFTSPQNCINRSWISVSLNIDAASESYIWLIWVPAFCNLIVQALIYSKISVVRNVEPVK